MAQAKTILLATPIVLCSAIKVFFCLSVISCLGDLPTRELFSKRADPNTFYVTNLFKGPMELGKLCGRSVKMGKD